MSGHLPTAPITADGAIKLITGRSSLNVMRH